ncbi:MAG: enoyl-CoA hydratase/isomerase family protein [Desulfotomaculales bacterium]|jgi:enoyl-CoA hydratase
MSYETLLVNIEEQVAVVTLNRPPLNPLNSTMFRELGRVAGELAEDPGVRAVIFTGAGEKAFAAGADINEMKDLTVVEMYAFNQVSKEALNRIENLPKPTIAAVNGLALGGGCELTLCCDLRLASEKAKFGLPEINLGIIPGGGGTQRLPRLIGMGRAKELFYLGEMIDAARAEQIGLVNRVVAAADLLPEAVRLAKKLAEKSPLALGLLKDAAQTGYSLDLAAALDLEMKNFLVVFAGEDRREGISAFLEKRKPVFKGR